MDHSEGQPVLRRRESGVDRIGPYSLLARIAGGDFTTVHLAQREGTMGYQRLTAIKRLKPALARQPEWTQLLLDEARLSAGVRHPNIVDILDVGNDQQSGVYLVMGYVEGADLEALIARAGKERHPRYLMPPIVDALTGLHAVHTAHDELGESLSMVHQAPRARHILIGIDGVSRITDFSQVSARGLIPSTLRGKRLATGYMAPEQVLVSEPVSARTDLFIIGITLWETLTGQRLFEAENAALSRRAILERHIPRPSEVGLRPPACFDAICMRALQRNPEQRYQSAQQMAHELREAALSESCYASASELGQWVRALASRALVERRRAIGAEEPSQEISLEELERREREAQGLVEPAVELQPPSAGVEQTIAAAQSFASTQSVTVTNGRGARASEPGTHATSAEAETGWTSIFDGASAEAPAARESSLAPTGEVVRPGNGAGPSLPRIIASPPVGVGTPSSSAPPTLASVTSTPRTQPVAPREPAAATAQHTPSRRRLSETHDFVSPTRGAPVERAVGTAVREHQPVRDVPDPTPLADDPSRVARAAPIAGDAPAARPLPRGLPVPKATLLGVSARVGEPAVPPPGISALRRSGNTQAVASTPPALPSARAADETRRVPRQAPLNSTLPDGTVLGELQRQVVQRPSLRTSQPRVEPPRVEAPRVAPPSMAEPLVEPSEEVYEVVDEAPLFAGFVEYEDEPRPSTSQRAPFIFVPVEGGSERSPSFFGAPGQGSAPGHTPDDRAADIFERLQAARREAGDSFRPPPFANEEVHYDEPPRFGWLNIKSVLVVGAVAASGLFGYRYWTEQQLLLMRAGATTSAPVESTAPAPVRAPAGKRPAAGTRPAAASPQHAATAATPAAVASPAPTDTSPAAAVPSAVAAARPAGSAPVAAARTVAQSARPAPATVQPAARPVAPAAQPAAAAVPATAVRPAAPTGATPSQGSSTARTAIARPAAQAAPAFDQVPAPQAGEAALTRRVAPKPAARPFGGATKGAAWQPGQRISEPPALPDNPY